MRFISSHILAGMVSLIRYEKRTILIMLLVIILHV